jgi:hypothetical protein
MKIEKREYTVLDTGTYAATVASIVTTTGQFGEQLQWDFKLDDGSSQRAWCSMSLTPKSKLFLWSKALLGDVPDTLDTDALIGLPCRLSILSKAKEDGTEFNKVDQVLAPRKGQKPRLVPEPVEEVAEIPF